MRVPITNNHGTNGTNGAVSDKLHEPIAIVGASCRLPGEASSLKGLWNMMQNSRSAHAKVPKERWDADAWYHPDPDRKGSINTTHGFFLEEDVAAFDAPFFSVTAKEAAGMDPAKRLLLEVAYEAFENAGMPMDDIQGSMTGVYVGSMTSDYEVLSTKEVYDEPHMAAAGSSEAMTANRVSWFFDFRGPSLTLDTACSSSLYALHLACQSLRLGETNMGLVAGVNVILHPNFMQQLVAMHMLSPDGISHAFDDRANGYGRGEGIGCLIVKRLSDAIRDGDTIRAVVRGSGINVDGKTPSVTMPSPEAQASLIRTVYEEAKLPMDQTQYVELHGTGTPVGDPIELSAIAATFGASVLPENPVYVGSIKPNVGHTEGCAGLAGVFKAMMCLEKGVILPTPQVENVNPKLRLADWNLALPPSALAWPTPGNRRISVNSFGFGGANAHVILDDAYHYMKDHGLKGKHSTIGFPQLVDLHSETLLNGTNGNLLNGNGTSHRKVEALASSPIKRLFVLSSRDEPGIQRIGKSLGAHWKSDEDVLQSQEYLSNVAYTLAWRRSLLDYRSFAVAESTTALAEQLERVLPKYRRSTKDAGIAFIFTGQGAQWAGMGRQLIEFPAFATSISQSKAFLEALQCPFDLEIELQKVEHSKISTSEYSQPICTAVQVALVDLLDNWSVRPKAVAGHSSGEIAAAYAAGIITHEDAIKIAYLRGVYSGKVSHGPKRGAMLAAGISEEEARGYLEAVPQDSVVTACVNSPKSVTLSGDVEFIDQLEGDISKDNKFARKLRVATAYHSPHMRMVAEDCLAAMNDAGVGKVLEPKAPMFSSVTGQLIGPAELGSDYWIRNMCGTVRFSEAVKNLLTYSPGKRGARKARVKWNALIEIGPHSALKAPLVQIMEGVDSKLPSELPYTSMLARGEDAVESALKAAGLIWALGIPILLARVNREPKWSGQVTQRVVVNLPSYPWNHDKRYWHEAAATKQQRLHQRPRTDLLGVAVENQNPLEPQWKNYLRVRENPWVQDHKITGTTLYPGAGMLIMVIEAVQEMVSTEAVVKGVEFKNVHFERGLVINDDDATETSLRIQIPRGDDRLVHDFVIYSRIGDGAWTKHCYGSFSIVYSDPSFQSPGTLEFFEWKTYLDTYNALQRSSSQEVDVKRLYSSLDGVGMQYGPTFQNLASLFALPEKNACHGTITIPDTKSVMPHEYEFPHLIHPATLDAIFHLIVVAVANGATLKEAAVPFMLEKLFISFNLPQGPGALFSGYAQRADRRDKQLAADLIVSDASWTEPKIIVSGLIMRQVTAGTGASGNSLTGNNGDEKKTTNIVWKHEPESLWKTGAATKSDQIKIGCLRDWLELECHKSSDLKVLVVGSTLEKSILREISPFIHGESPYRGFARCTITDASEDALEEWTKLSTKGSTSLNFQIWDGISKMDESTFDLVIARRVGDSVGNSAAKWSLWHSLLRPSGRIIVLHDNEDAHVTSNGYKPLESDNELKGVRINLQNGTAIDLHMHADADTKHPNEAYILVPSTNGTVEPSKFAHSVSTALGVKGISTRTVRLEELHSLPQQPVISLLEDGFITNWSATEFDQFQKFVEIASHVFWVTRGAHMLTPSEPGLQSAPAPGLFRVLRNEFPQMTLVHLDLSTQFDETTTDAANLLVDTWLSSLDASATGKDLELAELGGQVLLPRAIANPSMDDEIARTSGSAQPIPQNPSSIGPLRLVTGSHDVAWEKDEVSQVGLGPDEVDIDVTDVSKDSQDSTWLGSQITGRVIRWGSNVTGFLKGDRVVAFGLPNCKTQVRQHHSLVLRVPESMASDGLATEIWIYTTAYYILKHTTHLEEDQKVLIQDGATCLGQALLYLARQITDHVFAMVKTEKQKEWLMKTAHIPEEYILVVDQNHDSGRVPAYILHHTNRQGLDVAICSAAESSLAVNLTPCLSDFAKMTFVVSGDHGVTPPILRGNISLSIVDPVQILQEKPQLVSRLLPEVLRLIQDSNGSLPEITPRIQFTLAELPEALEYMKKPEDSSIISIKMAPSEDGERIPVIPSAPPQLQLDGKATYILAGGLGSLGLRIADVMVASGATHLVFLSRSGGGRFTDRLLKLKAQGCTTMVLKCDVTSSEQVRHVITEVAQSGRPIKGVIQCAMVLNDSLFHNMSYSQWCTAFKPKVEGTWHLHDALPRDMDFFIMLSSVVSVIGNVSQANYAAGNAYMDALAHYRHSLGLAATSINAGLVADSDHTIDGTSMDEYLDRFKHMASVSTTLQELDIAIVAAMRGTTADGEPTGSQFVFCMSDSLQPDGVDQWARDRKFTHRIAVIEDKLSSADGQAGPSVGELLRSVTSKHDAVTIVQDALKDLLAPGLGVQTADIDNDRPLYALGVDSFKAVEVRNQVFRELQSDISVFEILSPSSLAQLSGVIVSRSQLVSQEVREMEA